MNWLADFPALAWSFLNRKIFAISGSPITPLSLLALALAMVAVFALGRWARRLVSRVILSRGNDAQRGLAYSIGAIVQYSVTILGVLVALDNVGISLTALAAFGAILTVGIGFGLQNIAQNFISGIILLIERPVQKGDFIIVGNTVGTVDSISMRATRVLSRDNVSIIVPNSKLITETVINQSAPDGIFRAHVAIGVAYGSDTKVVHDTLLTVAKSVPAVLAVPAPAVFFRDFADSSLSFELVIWLADPAPEPRVTSDLRFGIDAAFRAAGIEIPFPQRDLHLRSGWPLAGPIAVES
jgi:potassium efflux system protein